MLKNIPVSVVLSPDHKKMVALIAQHPGEISKWNFVPSNANVPPKKLGLISY